VGGWIDGWMDRWTEGRMNGVDGQTARQKNDGWMDEQIDGRMYRWMDGLLNG
jgi:hypothetical protein